MKILKSLLITCLIFTTLFCSSVIANTPWTSKPTLGSQINWGHPLAQGLVGCWLMNEGCGGKSYNLVNDLYLSAKVGTGWSVKLLGSGILSNNNNLGFETLTESFLKLKLPITLIYS